MSSNKRILIVEDSQPTADVFKEALELFGHEAECVYEWEKALDKINTDQFDIIFMDLNLNNMSGITLMKQIKLNPALNDKTRFIAVSGYSESHSIGIEASAVFDGYIEKPINLDKLELILNN